MFFHLPALFSKPYTAQVQKHKKFTQQKRVKRQAFGLRIAIYNKNVNMLKLLLNGTYSADFEGASYVTDQMTD